MIDRILSSEKGQSLVEMSLVLPVILLLVMGVFEFGRIIFTFSSVNNASREAARYGAATGTDTPSVPRYLDCDAIRQQAKETAFLAGLEDADIEIAYDTPNGGDMAQFAECGDLGLNASAVQLGDRIVVTITKQINPILPFIPSFTPSLTTSRTILKGIAIGNPECNDGADNDGDGFVDYPDDDGCSSLDDTIEAICYRLSVIALPEDAGTMSFVPGTNCSNRYIQGTIVNLEAFKDIRSGDYIDSPYTFDYWEGITTTIISDNPTTVTMDTDKTVIAHFRLLAADLGVTKTASPSTVESLKPLTYQITISNPITDTAHNVVMTDTLPSGVDFQGTWRTSRAGDAACNEVVTDSVIVCTLPELLAGDTATFEFDVIAPVVSYSAQNIVNTVTVSAHEFDPDLSNNTATAGASVLPRAGLSMLSKVDSVDPVDAAAPYDYTITVKNSGPSVATNVRVTDVLQSGLVWNSSPNCTYDGASRTVTCDIGELAVDEVRAVTFTVNAPDNGGTVSNTATVTSDEVEDDGTPDSASALTQVISHTDLELIKTGPPIASRDAQFSYSLAVNNLPAGPSDAFDVVITDTLPDNVDFQLIGISNPFGRCTVSGRIVACNVGNIAPGGGKYITLNVTSNITGTFENNATVSSAVRDDNPVNDSSSATTTVEVNVDLFLEKIATPETVEVGDQIDYTILASNGGPSIATEVSITDTMPDGVDLIDIVEPAGWSCQYDDDARLITCTPDRGTMTAGSNVEIQITGLAAEVGSHRNNSTLLTAEGNLSDGETVEIIPSLDLSLDISGPSQILLGEAITYTLTVANSGPSDASNLTVTSPLTKSVSFGQITSVDPNWSCGYEANDHSVLCTSSSMKASTQASFTITVLPVLPVLNPKIISQATIVANESIYDADPSNDTASLSTNLLNIIPLDG